MERLPPARPFRQRQPEPAFRRLYGDDVHPRRLQRAQEPAAVLRQRVPRHGDDVSEPLREL